MTRVAAVRPLMLRLAATGSFSSPCGRWCSTTWSAPLPPRDSRDSPPASARSRCSASCPSGCAFLPGPRTCRPTIRHRKSPAPRLGYGADARPLHRWPRSHRRSGCATRRAGRHVRPPLARIALFPVSNVLVPTGIILAERTLYLPSVGFLLVVGRAAARGLPGGRGCPAPDPSRGGGGAGAAPGRGHRGQCPAPANLGQPVFAVGPAAHRRAAQLSRRTTARPACSGKATSARPPRSSTSARSRSFRIVSPYRATWPIDLRLEARCKEAIPAVPAGASLRPRPERGPGVLHRLPDV